MEREKKLFDAITGIRDDLVEQAQNAKPKAKRLSRYGVTVVQYYCWY